MTIYFKVFSMEKMKLKILAISDTHLGEDVSLLSYPQGRQHLWSELRNLFGHTTDSEDRIEIDELIMIGDIPDRALSSTAQIMDATTNFVEMLGSLAKIKKGVYVPGNHDHTMWTAYIKARYGKDTTWKCTAPDGESILQKGCLIDLKSSQDLLATFFGYKYGSSWLSIEREHDLDFVIANPLYSTTVGTRTYVFTHGSHFKKEVTEWWAIEAIKALDLIDGLFVGIDVESGCDVTNGCDSLEMLEKKVGPFLDSLWKSPKNFPTGKSDRYWYLLKLLSSFGKIGREIPCCSNLFSYEDLKAGLADRRIEKLTDGSIKRWRDYFLPQMVQYLRNHGRMLSDLTFVYGDTHIGGWEEVSSELVGGLNGPIRVYNTGGWIAHANEGHPACHVFAVDDKGKEYMLDISFTDVEISGEPLITVASRDAENSTILLRKAPLEMIKLRDKLKGESRE